MPQTDGASGEWGEGIYIRTLEKMSEYIRSPLLLAAEKTNTYYYTYNIN